MNSNGIPMNQPFIISYRPDESLGGNIHPQRYQYDQCDAACGYTEAAEQLPAGYYDDVYVEITPGYQKKRQADSQVYVI